MSLFLGNSDSILINPEKVDFGTIDSVSEKNILIYNTSDNEIIVYDALASCGCVSVKFKDHIIPPNDKITLTIKCDASKIKSGKFEQSIYIITSSEKNPIKIPIIGFVTTR